MAAQDRLLAGESQALIAIVEELAEELRQGTIRGVGLTLSSSLDRDVGLDSLGRVEPLARIERRLGVHLPEQIAPVHRAHRARYPYCAAPAKMLR